MIVTGNARLVRATRLLRAAAVITAVNDSGVA
jgi:hypothetical protein